MFLTKLKSPAAIILAVALLGPGAGWFAQESLPPKPTKVVKSAGKRDSSEVTGTVTAVDTERRTVTLRAGKQAPEPQTFDPRLGGRAHDSGLPQGSGPGKGIDHRGDFQDQGGAAERPDLRNRHEGPVGDRQRSAE